MRKIILSKQKLSLLTVTAFIAVGIPMSASAEDLANADTESVNLLLTVDGTPDGDGGGGGDPAVCSPTSSLVISSAAPGFADKVGTFTSGRNVASISYSDKLDFWGYTDADSYSLGVPKFSYVYGGDGVGVLGVSYSVDTMGGFIPPDTDGNGQVDAADSNPWLENDRSTFQSESFTVTHSVDYASDMDCTGTAATLTTTRTGVEQSVLNPDTQIETLEDYDLFPLDGGNQASLSTALIPANKPGIATAHLSFGSDGSRRIALLPRTEEVISRETAATTTLTAWMDVFGTANQIKGKSYSTGLSFDLYIDDSLSGP